MNFHIRGHSTPTPRNHTQRVSGAPGFPPPPAAADVERCSAWMLKSRRRRFRRTRAPAFRRVGERCSGAAAEECEAGSE
jgi:hypothetical protein